MSLAWQKYRHLKQGRLDDLINWHLENKMINSVSSASTQAVSAASQVQAKPVDSDGDNDGSKAASAASKIGPAVIVSLSGAGKSDAAQGDPDHDGK